jgi:hypothetical protein
MSSSSAYGVNSLRIGDREYLLAVGGGWAVHLVPEAADAEDRRPAAAVEDLDPSTPGFNPAAAGYDRDALTATRWRPTTLCGREWGIMAAGRARPHPPLVLHRHEAGSGTHMWDMPAQHRSLLPAPSHG